MSKKQVAKYSEREKQESDLREPPADYIRNTDIPTFFGQPMLKGTYMQAVGQLDPQLPVLFYSHPRGEIWVGDAIAWLRSLESESADLVFADSPYNIKKAEWDTFESQQEYLENLSERLCWHRQIPAM